MIATFCIVCVWPQLLFENSSECVPMELANLLQIHGFFEIFRVSYTRMGSCKHYVAFQIIPRITPQLLEVSQV